jgi:hypothetical protein
MNETQPSVAETRKPTPDEQLGMAWWNNLTKAERAVWMSRAGHTGVAADAWAAFKATTGR